MITNESEVEADSATPAAAVDARTEPTRWQRRAVGAIEFYQRAAEGRPSPCRFTPSCSAYAHEALEVHGTRRGLWLTIRRLLRCRPFGPSGWDPVPEPAASDAPHVHSRRDH